MSCVCLTYGRTACLNEAVAFFLAQDYGGPKELIVVNDLDSQEIVYAHPQVHIFNVAERFANLGRKRDFAIRQARGEVIVTWDDDDGYLPAHLRTCVDLIDGYDYAKPDKCIVMVRDNVAERVASSFMPQVVFTRELYLRAGGYRDQSFGEDTDLSHRMLALPGTSSHFAVTDDAELTYLYRWANDEYHLSGYGPDRPELGGYELVAAAVHRRQEQGREPRGRVTLQPALRHDYAGLVRRFLSPDGVPGAVLRKREFDVRVGPLFDEDLAPPWSLSMWIEAGPAATAPVALFDSEAHAIRLAQHGALDRFGVTRYGHRDFAFDFRPDDQLHHLALVARPGFIELHVDGQPTQALAETIHFPRSVADDASLLEYRVFRGALSKRQVVALSQEPPSRREPETRVQFLTNWLPDAQFGGYLSKMTQDGRTWNALRIVDSRPDYTVVVNHPRGEPDLDPARTIHLRMEPECVRRNWGSWYKPDATRAVAAYDEHNAIEWHLSCDYRTLLASSPAKTKVLSAVVSDFYFLPGHRLRVDFVRGYLDKLPYFDHFGRGDHHQASFRGPVARKEDGLFPYKYTFAAENCAEPGYFTEKVVDAILSECLVFYWGCPDLERWIAPEAFVRVDLEHPREALSLIERTIAQGAWEARLEHIRREKRKILQELHIFPTLERIISRLHT